MSNNGRDERSIRKDERKRIKKRKRAKGTLYTMIGALLAFLISIFSGLLGLNPVGFYGDGSGSHSLIKQEATVEPNEEAEPIAMSDEVAEEELVSRLIVHEQDYIYQDQVYDLAGITEVINGMDQVGYIELVDRSAISDTFSDVEAVLQSKDIEYVIVEE